MTNEMHELTLDQMDLVTGGEVTAGDVADAVAKVIANVAMLTPYAALFGPVAGVVAVASATSNNSNSKKS
jgi:hypothetical protein